MSRQLHVLLALVCAFPATGFADATQQAIKRAIDIRHVIHQNPELSNRETETAALVANRLRELGIEVQTGVAHTGVIGILRGGKPGPVVGVRADMDALPVTEASGYPFASTKRTLFLDQEVGVAHACGHDIHVAVALGTAEILAGMRDELSGTVKFIFQPAEEGAPPGEKGGARLMLEQGVLDNPRPGALFALHSFPNFKVGEIGWVSGPTQASSDTIVITLHGKQAHGAWPHQSVDPIVMAAQVIQAIQTIRSRNMNPTDPGVVSIGMIRGGQRHNIIPASIEMRGTARAYDVAVQDLVEKRLHEILGGITQANGGSYELEYTRNNPALINHPALSEWARSSLNRSVGESGVKVALPVMGAEDFAYFANEIPSFYYRLGVLKPGTTSGALHTPDLRADDSAIEIGIRSMTGLLLDFLKENPNLDD